MKFAFMFKHICSSIWEAKTHQFVWIFPLIHVFLLHHLYLKHSTKTGHLLFSWCLWIFRSMKWSKLASPPKPSVTQYLLWWSVARECLEKAEICLGQLTHGADISCHHCFVTLSYIHKMQLIIPLWHQWMYLSRFRTSGSSILPNLGQAKQVRKSGHFYTAGLVLCHDGDKWGLRAALQQATN